MVPKMLDSIKGVCSKMKERVMIPKIGSYSQQEKTYIELSVEFPVLESGTHCLDVILGTKPKKSFVMFDTEESEMFETEMSK